MPKKVWIAESQIEALYIKLAVLEGAFEDIKKLFKKVIYEQEIKERTDLVLSGRDHRSLLLYVEDRCVNHKGHLALMKLRVNENTHPLMKVLGSDEWKKANGTRFDSGKASKVHDDIDCLEELETSGFIEIISMINGFVALTDKGHACAAKLRKERAKR